jgi:hypothetical protein
MVDEKVIELFTFYTGAAEAVQLHENEYKRRVTLDAVFTNRDGHSRSMRELAIEHAVWMATQGRKMIEEARTFERNNANETPATLGRAREFREGSRSKREKAHRWLGFIQGVLWMSGVFTLDELKEHSHKCSDDYKEPADG